MTFQSAISRSPYAFDKDRGQEIRALYDDLAPELAGVLEGAGGSSPFLHRLLSQEEDWLRQALSLAPDTVLPAVFEGLKGKDLSELNSELRRAKRRVALYTGLADLAGVWTLEQVTGALTDFADLSVDLGAKAFTRQLFGRGKLPGVQEADLEDSAGLVFLAMGKMGAHELNYSSDIDLIALYDDSRFQPDDQADVRSAFIRATRSLSGLLAESTGEGYVFRTDLRLRPDPSVTPVCLSMSAAEGYYESVGRTWERAAHIKARPCGGDIKAGWDYLERLRPFIWRKHLDFAAIQDAHDMRLRIREHKGLSRSIELAGHNMKLGRGGIREIEFFTQTRQIIAGGRDKDLRVRGTVEGLEVLAAKGWIPQDVAETLTEDYRAHRDVEHRIQMVNDAQTHDIPKSDDGFERIAALAGRDPEEYRNDIRERLTRVSSVIEGFFEPQVQSSAAGGEAEPELSETSHALVSAWRSYPAMRSARASDMFEQLLPEILRKLNEAARPEEAIIEFDRFLKGLPAGVQVFSLFASNPHLIDLIVDIAGTAPHLAAYLGRNSKVFDGVIGGQFFEPWPDTGALVGELAGQLAEIDDYELRLNAARRWMKEWHFRVGVHQLRGLISEDEAGVQYAALADAVMHAIWPIVTEEFARKHGVQPGKGAVVMGMGSLGSQRLTAKSDLDVIMIYDAEGVEESGGKRPLATRTYFARLTQALVTALSAPMSDGRLYEVDMRLRPSGRQGPVATSFGAFKQYQQSEAWTWEHLALTRARPVVGSAVLKNEIEAFRREILQADRDVVSDAADVQEMRARLAEAKKPGGPFEAKLGAGRMQDIELLAQLFALSGGDPSRRVSQQLRRGRKLGWIDDDELDHLVKSYRLVWQLQSAARLLTGDVLNPDEFGQGGLDFLLRETSAPDAEALVKKVEDAAGRAAEIIDTALARLSKGS